LSAITASKLTILSSPSSISGGTGPGYIYITTPATSITLGSGAGVTLGQDAFTTFSQGVSIFVPSQVTWTANQGVAWQPLS